MRRPTRLQIVGLDLLVALLVLVLAGLGAWQVRRLEWKTRLIAEVDARVHAPAAPAPGPVGWAALTRERDQYRHVFARGRFLNDRETLTQAVTDYGAGYWVMTPFRTDQGFLVLVNRGFVPQERREPASRTAGRIDGEVTTKGLLRWSEPHGGFLQTNQPEADQWHSRDVAAIAARRGLPDVAPYFIDADATSNPGDWPKGGLTVISFPNNHLVYALTWFTMALGLAAAWTWTRLRGPLDRGARTVG